MSLVGQCLHLKHNSPIFLWGLVLLFLKLYFQCQIVHILLSYNLTSFSEANALEVSLGGCEEGANQNSNYTVQIVFL